MRHAHSTSRHHYQGASAARILQSFDELSKDHGVARHAEASRSPQYRVSVTQTLARCVAAATSCTFDIDIPMAPADRDTYVLIGVVSQTNIVRAVAT